MKNYPGINGNHRLFAVYHKGKVGKSPGFSIDHPSNSFKITTSPFLTEPSHY